MTAQVPYGVSVQAVRDHVEVVGLTKEAVEYAISLYQSVTRERIQARSVLASHVNRVMLDEGIELISAASQRQLQRSAALRQNLIEEQGVETYASLSRLRDSQESSVRTWVSRMRRRGELFTVEHQGLTLIPMVQLTDAGGVDPLIAQLQRPLIRAGLDGWSLWAWLTNPTGLLSGAVPAEVAATNIRRASKAAERYAEELRRGRENID